MKSRVFLISLCLVTFLTACKKDSQEPRPEAGSVQSYEFGLSYSSEALYANVKVSGLDIPLEELKYDVEMFRVNYYTTFKGDNILASGIVILPKTDDVVSTISFQHGTIAGNAEAPSMLKNNDPEYILYSALAATGLVVVVPDFIGFGASSDIMHPYYVESPTANAIIDNLKASLEMCSEFEINRDNQLFLAGYSQGGYATMVAHKYLETVGMESFELIASFAASGGYDIKGMQEYFFIQETYDQPYFLAYVAQAYNETFEWGEDLSLYFQEPYNARIPDLFDGSKTGSEINAQLTNEVSALVNEGYLQDDGTNPDYHLINDAYVANSPLNWKPSIPLYMYHGDADITVPYQNSVDVYNHFISNGASENMVTFTNLSEGTHFSGFTMYLEAFVNELIAMKTL